MALRIRFGRKKIFSVILSALDNQSGALFLRGRTVHLSAKVTVFVINLTYEGSGSYVTK